MEGIKFLKYIVAYIRAFLSLDHSIRPTDCADYICRSDNVEKW